MKNKRKSLQKSVKPILAKQKKQLEKNSTYINYPIPDLPRFNIVIQRVRYNIEFNGVNHEELEKTLHAVDKIVDVIGI